MSFRSFAAALAIASAAACLPAAAAPVTLLAGETKTFVFDATASVPYTFIRFVVGFDELDGLKQGGTVFAYESLESVVGYGVGGCDSDFGSCASGFEFQQLSVAGMLDGNFTLVVSNTGPSGSQFSVDPYARVFTQGATSFTRVDPIATVPEPSVLALLAAGLAGVAFTRRRKV